MVCISLSEILPSNSPFLTIGRCVIGSVSKICWAFFTKLSGVKTSKSSSMYSFIFTLYEDSLKSFNDVLLCFYLKPMTKLSVNINKIATLRNSRGGDVPNLLKVAKDIQEFGAQGITIHPRPDERHIRYQDALDLKSIVSTEYNIEGNPIPKFMDLVLNVKPTQVTLVPDNINQITSNAGWDTIVNQSYLKDVISEFKNAGIRTSIFIDTDLKLIEAAAKTGTDRIELYTEHFASAYGQGNKHAVKPYTEAANLAHELGLGINAGHDLSLENIEFFKQNIPNLAEVSIGHALISESLYLGLENVVNMYIHRLQ
jgi:pyridoxine 5-phosphate synthase